MTPDRKKDIETLKAHCSLLRGLPTETIATLYGGWSMMLAEEPWVEVNNETAACFTDHVVWLWSGEGS